MTQIEITREIARIKDILESYGVLSDVSLKVSVEVWETVYVDDSPSLFLEPSWHHRNNILGAR